MWLLEKNMNRRAFTLIELLLVIGIIASLMSIVILSVNPRKMLMNAQDAARNSAASTIEKAMTQYLIDQGGSLSASLTVPTGLANAKPICKAGVTSSTCMNIDVLSPTYLASVPQDSQERCTNFSGYKIYKDGSFMRVIPTNTGKPAADIAAEPNCVGGIQLWLSADTITGVSAGGSVSTWTDYSGSGNNAIAMTTPPVLRVNQQNGKPAVEFPYGSPIRYMNISNPFIIKEAFMVFKSMYPTFDYYATPLGSQSYGAGNQRPFITTANATTTWADPVPSVVRKNGTNITQAGGYYDLGPNLTSYMIVTVDVGNPTVSRLYQVGASEAAYGGSIQVAEIIGFNSVLSAADRGLVETYLNTKYKIY
jgi:prepilin-type N-terminal cleavage/methylation domain-containing protein